MSRSRKFIFAIDNYNKDELNYICNLEKNGICEYILISKDVSKINGCIRFLNARTISSIKKLFSNRAIVEIHNFDETKYKEQMTNVWFESIKIVKSSRQQLEEKNKQLEEKIEEKDKIINIVETQNSKLMQHSETMIEFVNAFKNSKENDSDQIKQITNLCMTMAKNAPTTITTNNNNNNFNLNFFLNEYCKDAINMVDFAKSIQIKLEDVLLYKKIGHVEAVSQIFDTAYNKLDLKMRPMHCTDVKRETLYIRSEDKWINDETKELSEKAIDIISNNSFRQIKQWKEANPDYITNEDTKQEYILLMKQLVGGSSDREMDENAKKIIKNISKTTQIDKNKKLTSV